MKSQVVYICMLEFREQEGKQSGESVPMPDLQQYKTAFVQAQQEIETSPKSGSHCAVYGGVRGHII